MGYNIGYVKLQQFNDIFVCLKNKNKMSNFIELLDKYEKEMIMNPFQIRKVLTDFFNEAQAEQLNLSGVVSTLCDHKFENNRMGAEVCVKCKLPYSIPC
jgi:uncharacterized protein (UPF0333 family)